MASIVQQQYQLDPLTRSLFLFCGRRCDRIKPFDMGRKNFLFANTPAGAQSSAVIYSIIETAKENGLGPYRYLLWIFQTAPKQQQGEHWAEKLLPAMAPVDCKVK